MLGAWCMCKYANELINVQMNYTAHYPYVHIFKFSHLYCFFYLVIISLC